MTSDFTLTQPAVVPVSHQLRMTDSRETASSSVRHKIVMRQLLWVFVICSIVGCLWETFFCWITTGYVSCRQGFIYGPLSPIYGVGGVIMCLTVVPVFRKKGWLVGFLAGTLTGGAVEFLGSYVQELLTGTRSWDYTNHVFSIGGRTNIVFMCGFGLMGCAFAKWGYPRFESLFARVRPLRNKAVCAVIVVLLALNAAVSLLAIDRWSERDEGVQPTNIVDTYMDNHFPDQYMTVIYPTMEHAVGN